MLVRGRSFAQTTDGDTELGPEARWCSRRTPGTRQRSAPTAYAATIVAGVALAHSRPRSAVAAVTAK